jgi:hypothetical protein
MPESGPADLRTSVRGFVVRDELNATTTPATTAASKKMSAKPTARRDSLGTTPFAAGWTGAAAPEDSDSSRAARLPARRAAPRDRRGRPAVAAGAIDRAAITSAPPSPSSIRSKSDHHHKNPAATSSSITYSSAVVPRDDRPSASAPATSAGAVWLRTKPARPCEGLWSKPVVLTQFSP